MSLPASDKIAQNLQDNVYDCLKTVNVESGNINASSGQRHGQDNDHVG